MKVCVYLGRANEAIIRKFHPILTVEELLHDLNGSTMLRKVDLKLGFHQTLSLSGKSAYKQVCNAPVTVLVQAVVIWCHMGTRKSSR